MKVHTMMNVEIIERHEFASCVYVEDASWHVPVPWTCNERARDDAPKTNLKIQVRKAQSKQHERARSNSGSENAHLSPPRGASSHIVICFQRGASLARNW